MVISDIKVKADPSLSEDEIRAVVNEEIKLWQQDDRVLGSVELTLDGGEIVVQAAEKSPIRRVRRITGYLSNIENFNDAKMAECRDRVTHSVSRPQ